MDTTEKIVWIVMGVALLLCGITAAYGEQRADVYETLRLNQLQPPQCVCSRQTQK